MPPFWLIKTVSYGLMASVAAHILGARLHRRACAVLAVVGICVLFWVEATDPSYRVDAMTFWRGGRRLLAGETPYAERIINPPTAFPLLALFALLPQSVFLGIWSILSSAGLLLLAPLGLWAVRPEGKRPEWWPDPPLLALFSAAVSLSMAGAYQRAIGQNSFVIGLFIFGAVAWADRGKPVRAGIALALASLKVGTLIAFLTLFLRKKDWKVWTTMAAAGLVFVLATTPVSKIPTRVRENLDQIRSFSGEGQVNDYSFRGPESLGLLTIGKLTYHLGIRNRTWVTAVELAGSLAILGWLAWRMRTLSSTRAAQLSIVTCASLLFLYHRMYDGVILALPLVYAAGRGQVAAQGSRGYYRGAALACLAVLFTPAPVLSRATEYARAGTWGGRLVEATIVPGVIWCVIAALVLLVEAERRASSDPLPSPVLPAAPTPAAGPPGS